MAGGRHRSALRDGAVADLLVDHPESTLTSFIGPAPEDLAKPPPNSTGACTTRSRNARTRLSPGSRDDRRPAYFVPDPIRPPRTASARCCVSRTRPSASW